MKPLTPRQLIEKEIQKNGIQMSKQISSDGLFTNATYDNRTVYSIDKMYELNAEGFYVSSNIALLLLNALLK